MSANIQSEVTFERLKQFLLTIGFEQPARANNTLAFHHRESETIVMLTVPDDGRSVRPADLLSILVRLENKGLVPESVLAQFRLGKLPAAS